MAGDIYKLYPQYQINTDRRQEYVSVENDRRHLGTDRRDSERVKLPSVIKKDLYELKKDFENVYANFDSYNNLSKSAAFNFYGNVSKEKQNEAQKRELWSVVASPFPMARRIVNIKNSEDSDNPVKAVGLAAIAAINAKEDIRDILQIANRSKISDMPQNSYAKYGFFVGTSIEKWFHKNPRKTKFLDKIDKTVGESPFFTKIANKLLKEPLKIDAYHKTIKHLNGVEESVARKCVRLNCKKPLKLAILTLHRMPVIGLIVAGLLELPAIIKTKAKDKFKQTANSSLNVICGSLTGALLSAAAAIFLPTVAGGSIMALGIGYYLGSKISKAIGFKLSKDN